MMGRVEIERDEAHKKGTERYTELSRAWGE